MDLERIKQNLRLRSGRNKPKKRLTKKTDAHIEQPRLKDPSTSLSNVRNPNGKEIDQNSEEPVQGPNELSVPSPAEPAEAVSERETQDKQGQFVSVNGHLELEQNVDSPPDPASEHTSSPTDIAKDTVEGPADATEQEETHIQHHQSPDVSQPMSEHQSEAVSLSSEAEDFDLNPPKPQSKPTSVESLAELLFSCDHLNSLLHHPPQLTQFSAFLQKYMPETFPLLSQYLETQKAIKAVEYANAVAYGFKPEDIGDGGPTTVRKSAATLDPEFEAICKAAFEALVGTALPQYITYQLIKVCSECLTNEITGRQSTAVMRDLVGGLSEVFCLTDPHQEDNPIIYASEEFYRLTGYGEQDVIGNNCRFLQGKKTNPDSPKRLKIAIKGGEHIYETLLNYRRDGRPFINILLIAPLYDKDNKVKYHIGAQVDVSGLVEAGRALPGFQRFLNRCHRDRKREERERIVNDMDNGQKRKSRALARLRDLSEMFDLEESAIVRETSRANSLTREDDEIRSIASTDRQRTPRRVLADTDSSDDEEGDKQDSDDGPNWKLAEAGNGKISGKLPGIYDSFMLFRPYPSLRIVFLSPKLQKFSSVLQTPILSHVAAPTGILSGLTESLKTGVPVLAKIFFRPERGVDREGTKLKRGTKHEDGKHGKAVWMSCTPLLGADERIGVWMCVVVEKSKTSRLSGNNGAAEQNDDRHVKSTSERLELEDLQDKQAEQIRKEDNSLQNGQTPQRPNREGSMVQDVPIKPVRISSQTVVKKVTEQSPETSTRRVDNQNNPPGPNKEANLELKQNNGGEELENGSKPESMREDGAILRAESGQVSNHTDYATKPATSSAQDPKPSSRPYSINLPSYGLDIGESQESQVDEYVTTRSNVPSAQSYGRVLIQEDSDFLTDEHNLTDQEIEQARSSSTSPIWSPANESPPSVPSDAQFSNGDELDTGDSASQWRQSAHCLEPEIPIDNKETEKEQIQDSPSEERTDAEEPSADAALEAVEGVENREETEQNLDEHDLTPMPATPSDGIQDAEENEAEEEETLVSPEKMKSDDNDGRPLTAIDTSSHTRMDYLKAGSKRWQQGRNPRRFDLTQENFQLAGVEHRDEDDWSSDVDCARSPYSVD